jgi:hypothetical protein
LNRGDRTEELVGRARAILFSADDKLDRAALWRAYVSIEYAIMDLKLRHGLEGQTPPKKLSRKAVTDITAAKSMVGALDTSSIDKKKLLHDLRACRDMLKAVVASHERRSTTS